MLLTSRVSLFQCFFILCLMLFRQFPHFLPWRQNANNIGVITKQYFLLNYSKQIELVQ